MTRDEIDAKLTDEVLDNADTVWCETYDLNMHRGEDEAHRAAYEAQRLILASALQGEPVGGCPCLYVAPCGDNCSCAHPLLSGGCLRCCAYGSLEQRRTAATTLALQGEPERGKTCATCEALRQERDWWKEAHDAHCATGCDCQPQPPPPTTEGYKP